MAAGNPAINAAVQQIVNAQKAPIVNAQARYDAQAQQQQTNITGLSQALAGILGGIAPGVEQTYADASTRQAGFAKGFSDQLQEALGRNATNTSSFLQNVVGAPASQIDQVKGQVAPAAAGDTLYGLRGFIPASTLNREGAAFTAAAKQLPSIANTQGLQQIAKVQAAQRDQDAAFGDKLAEIAGTIPKLRSDLEQQAYDNAFKERAFAAGRSDEAFNRKIEVAKYKTGVQEFNASQKLSYARMAQDAYQSDRSYQVSLANLGIAQKRAQLAALAQEAKLNSGGFTPLQIQKFSGAASQIAAGAFTGIPKLDIHGEVITKNGKTQYAAPPLTYKQAIREMKKGDGKSGAIPLSIAMDALNSYYKPGVRGRPLKNTGTASFDFSAVGQLTNPFSGPLGKVTLASGADRAGASTSPAVKSLVGRVAAVFGKPLTITTGTNHNEYVKVAPGEAPRVSDHWSGNAADILYGRGSPGRPDPALTRLGQAALVAAGADPKWARQQRGGLFNLDTPAGRVQVIFNSMEGGNHFNHLHVGVR